LEANRLEQGVESARQTHLSEAVVAAARPRAIPPREALAEIQAHPAFAAAVREAATGFVELYQGNRVLNSVLNDRGRAIFGLVTLYLHFAPPRDGRLAGFTVTEAKELCVEQGVCSAGRAGAAIMLMRLVGYLEPLPGAGDRRKRLYGATERLVAIHEARWRRLFAAMTPLCAGGPALVAALDDPRFTPAYARRLGEDYCAGLRLLHHAPQLGLFAERNAGMLVLFSLLVSRPAAESLLPGAPVQLSVSGLARRFHVSRVHVLKLLRDAEAEGLIVRAGSSQEIAFTPRLVEAVRDFFATMFLYVARSVRMARTEMTSAEPR
jgi:hypothetical protein